jgi:hypothetical protein
VAKSTEKGRGAMWESTGSYISLVLLASLCGGGGRKSYIYARNEKLIINGPRVYL